MVFSLLVKGLPQQTQAQALSYLPVDGRRGTAWRRQGQMRKMAHGCVLLQHLVAGTWAVPQAQLLTAARKSQMCKSHYPRARRAADDLPPEQTRSLSCRQRVTATKAVPFSQDRYSFLDRL